MPVPQHFAPDRQEREREREREREPSRERTSSQERARSPPRPRPSGSGHRRDQSGPTEAEQVKNAYRAPIPVHNQPSPRPHTVDVPLDDIYVPTLDAKSGRFEVPPAHEWQKTTPTPSVHELPQSRTPAQSPRLFAGGSLPANGHREQQYGNVPSVPSKTPKTTASSVRSKAYSYDPRSRSPDHSTPLSQFSLLHEDPVVPPISIPMPAFARNRSVLSVIHEQSDVDNSSPIARMNSMSPSRRNPYESSQPMPNVPYLAAAQDQGRGQQDSSLLDGRNVEMPVPQTGVSFLLGLDDSSC